MPISRPKTNSIELLNYTDDNLVDFINIVDSRAVSETGEYIQPDFEMKDTLGQILAQLKIINLHLSLMTDITINKTEVE